MSRRPRHPQRRPVERPPLTNRPPSGLARAIEPREVPAPASLVASMPAVGGYGYLRTYRYGDCTVIVTREGGLFHLSISNPARLPSWEEVSGAWYKCIPDAATRRGAMMLPPLHEYVNYNPNCLQVMELAEEEVPRAPER